MTAGAAARVACLLAGQPGGFGGVHVRARAERAREAWLDHLRALLPRGTPWLRVPVAASAEALLGGLDLAATLAARRPVALPGLLERAHGGVLVLALAERAQPLVLACLQQALDLGRVRVERDGLQGEAPARFSLLLLEETRDEDAEGAAGLPAGLLDRLSFALDGAALAEWHAAQGRGGRPAPGAPAPAPADAGPGFDALAALCTSAAQLGVESLRAPLQALQVARALAMGQGRPQPGWQEVVEAAGLVYASRACSLPASADQAPPSDPSTAPERSADPPPSPAADAPPPPADAAHPAALPDAAGERLVEAVLAQLPDDLLARLAQPAGGRGSGRNAARLQRRQPARHGRPLGSRPGDPRHGLPLDLLATLRAALPWQRLRPPPPDGRARLSVRAGDLRVRVLKPRQRSTAVFAVDASGSAALHRLNEAKGAVAALLAQCYVRRDQVALVSFRGAGARLCLPPTRSLSRVHRELAGLPGGGGTPLAGGLEMATRLAGELQRRGEAPLVVLLTDGRANVGLDGIGGRARAEQQALGEAGRLRAAGIPALLVDISPQAQPRAAALAQAMGADYLALPAASAERLAAAVARRMPVAESRRA